MSNWNDKSQKAWNNAWSENNAVSSASGLLGTITGILSSSLENAEIEDTSAIENEINSRKNTTFDYGDFDSLMSAYNNRRVKANYTQEDFTKDGRLSNVLGATASGAIGGAQIGGPWGALIGGAVGLLGSGTGFFIGNHKARQAADKLNAAADDANRRYMSNFAASASNISNSMFNNSLLNLAAEGGFIGDSRFPYLNVAYTRRKMNSKVKPMLTKYAGLGNYYAYGGELPRTGDWSNGVVEVTAGGSHEENPNGGVPMGVDQNGVPNLVEEGEVVFNDYVFSKRLDVPEELLDQVKLPKRYADKPFADVAKLIQKESEQRPNDYISKNGLMDGMIKLMTVQELVRAKKGLTKPQEGNTHASGDWLRIAPIVGTGVQTLADIFGATNQEDYTNADIIRRAADNIRTVRSRPIGNYMTYTPMDVNYEQTRLGNQTLGTQGNVLNTASGNRSAALNAILALNSSANQNRGALYRQALDYNNARRAEAERFNAGINQFNSQQGMQADVYNQRGDMARMQSAFQEARMRDAIETAMSQAKSTNRTSFLNNLGLLGRENTQRNQIQDLIDSGVLVDYRKRTAETVGNTTNTDTVSNNPTTKEQPVTNTKSLFAVPQQNYSIPTRDFMQYNPYLNDGYPYNNYKISPVSAPTMFNARPANRTSRYDQLPSDFTSITRPIVPTTPPAQAVPIKREEVIDLLNDMYNAGFRVDDVQQKYVKMQKKGGKIQRRKKGLTY